MEYDFIWVFLAEYAPNTILKRRPLSRRPDAGLPTGSKREPK